MDRFNAKEWIEKEASKLPAMIQYINSHPSVVIGLDLAVGYDDHLRLYRPIPNSLDYETFDQGGSLTLVLVGGSRLEFSAVYGGQLISCPTAQLKVFSYSEAAVQAMVRDEVQKVVREAIADIQAEIVRWEEAIKTAEPESQIKIQAAVDSFVNEGEEGYYRPLPMKEEHVESARAEIIQCQQELEFWQSLQLVIKLFRRTHG